MLEGWVSDCAYAPYWMCTTRFMCHICRGTLQNFQLWTGGCPSPVVQLRNALGIRARMGLLGIPDVWASSTASCLAAQTLACIRTRIRQQRALEVTLRGVVIFSETGIVEVLNALDDLGRDALDDLGRLLGRLQRRTSWKTSETHWTILEDSSKIV